MGGTASAAAASAASSRGAAAAAAAAAAASAPPFFLFPFASATAADAASAAIFAASSAVLSAASAASWSKSTKSKNRPPFSKADAKSSSVAPRTIEYRCASAFSLRRRSLPATSARRRARTCSCTSFSVTSHMTEGQSETRT